MDRNRLSTQNVKKNRDSGPVFYEHDDSSLSLNSAFLPDLNPTFIILNAINFVRSSAVSTIFQLILIQVCYKLSSPNFSI